jgi:hypothetical protein
MPRSDIARKWRKNRAKLVRQSALKKIFRLDARLFQYGAQRSFRHVSWMVGDGR